MTDFKEEAYVLEKMEISEDDDEGFDYKEIKHSEDGDLNDMALDSIALDDEDDLDDFDALKTKTEAKRMAQAKTEKGITMQVDATPKTIERDVVIDDFIRNFMQKFDMNKTLNIFMQEWHEL